LLDESLIKRGGAHGSAFRGIVLSEKNVVIRSRLVGALSTVIVKSRLTSKVVSCRILVMMWMVCFTTTTHETGWNGQAPCALEGLMILLKSTKA